jgi:hypothetical protein
MTVLLLLLPAALLFALLLLGRYPGEDAVADARSLPAGIVRPPAELLVPFLLPARRAVAGLPRGGRLVGAAIAARPPPLAGVVQHP